MLNGGDTLTATSTQGSLSLSVSLHTDAIPTGIIRACSRSPCPSLPPSCQSSPVSLGRNRGSSVVVEIPPWRSGDRGSRGTPPGTRIEHLVAAPDEGSAQEEGSNRGGREHGVGSISMTKGTHQGPLLQGTQVRGTEFSGPVAAGGRFENTPAALLPFPAQ